MRMTSTKAIGASSQDENLKQLLQDRIAQLESRQEDPPKTADEQAAEDAFQVASTAAKALIGDTEIAAEEKLRVLQSMFTDCITNVRTLDYDLGLEEKRLSIAELDYTELGEDLRKIEDLTDKLKTLSRELSKQNKVMMENSEKRTAEERGKREEIVEKFDEAMKDINARLSTDDSADEEKDEVITELEGSLQQLQEQYDEREEVYQTALNEVIDLERTASGSFQDAEEQLQKGELALVIERRSLMDLRKQSRMMTRDIEYVSENRHKTEEQAKERREALKRQNDDVSRLQQSEVDLKKEMGKLNNESEELKDKARQAALDVKAEEDDLEFWKSKLKGEVEKRETLERLCRTLTEERTVLRKEVQAMQTAWGLLEREIENLRLEIGDPEQS